MVSSCILSCHDFVFTGIDAQLHDFIPGGAKQMSGKRFHTGKSFFSTAFGLVVISVGLVWLLQNMGIVPAGIRVLEYACATCMILLGIRLLIPHAEKENTLKQEIK
jgi:hypothetical protein